MNQNHIYQIIVVAVMITGCKQNRSEINQSHFNDPLTEAYIHDPSELQMENDVYMVFSTGNGVQTWFRNSNMNEWKLAGRLDKPTWWDEVFPGNIGHFWAPCVPSKWVLYYSFEANTDDASAIGRAVGNGNPPDLIWEDDWPVVSNEDFLW